MLFQIAGSDHQVICMNSTVRVFLEFRKNKVDEEAEVARCLIFASFFVDDGTSKLRGHKFVHIRDCATVLWRWEGAKGFDRALAASQIPRCHCLFYRVPDAVREAKCSVTKF